MDDPWFTWVKGPGSIRITPRNAKGWAAFAIVMVLTMVPPLLLALVGRPPWWFVVLDLLWLAIMIGVALRLAWNRSEVIDLATLNDELKEFRAWKASRKDRR